MAKHTVPFTERKMIVRTLHNEVTKRIEIWLDAISKPIADVTMQLGDTNPFVSFGKVLA